MPGGKGKKGDRGPKGGYKVARSNLSIAERKAKLAELKKNSRCLRCGAHGHWAGDPECRFKGYTGKGPKPANGAGGGKPPADRPRTAYVATSGTVPPYEDDGDVVYLSTAMTTPGKESAFMAFRPGRRGADVNMEIPGGETLFTFGQHRGLS